MTEIKFTCHGQKSYTGEPGEFQVQMWKRNLDNEQSSKFAQNVSCTIHVSVCFVTTFLTEIHVLSSQIVLLVVTASTGHEGVAVILHYHVKVKVPLRSVQQSLSNAVVPPSQQPSVGGKDEMSVVVLPNYLCRLDLAQNDGLVTWGKITGQGPVGSLHNVLDASSAS